MTLHPAHLEGSADGEGARSPQPRRWLLPAVLAAIAVVIVGALAWEQRSSTDTDTDTDTATSTATATATATDTDTASEPTVFPGPASDEVSTPPQDPGPDAAGVATGDAFLAMLFALSDVATPDELVVVFTLGNPVPAEVARCMSDAGFQYSEGPSAEQQVASDPRHATTPEEYAATYGFGVTAYELGLVPATPPDPDIEYVSSLSPGQRDAYHQALRACSAPAPDDPFRNSNAWNVALEQFRAAIAADQQVVDAIHTWRSCMSAAGFSYDTPQAMRESFYVRLGRGLSRDELQQLHTDEVAAAIANVPCEAAYRATYRDVMTARAEEFRDLFDAAVASGAAPEAQG